ncbi:condensation domain-containing protein [Paenibacillus sp. FJAT-26967]|uniref:condensation domain-containing protein n=1 Tax=Paenibacillus sp. FJAT-26967 TaxID=1729690 RepID=UPI000837F0A8|nr:condensation domain-containing protein [Paenibacillus sp. FJAT-26967]
MSLTLNDCDRSSLPSRYPVTPSDLFNYIASYHVSEQQIGYILHFRQRIDPHILEEAMKITVQLEPVLGCRFVEDPHQPYWQVRDDDEDLQLCTILELAAGESSRSAVCAYFTETFDRRQSPLVQARLIRGEEDTLCVKIFHACSDGAGLKAYIALLAEVYSGLAAEQSGTEQRLVEARGKCRDHGPLFSALGIRDIHAAFDPGQMKQAAWMFPSQPGEPVRPRVAIRQLEGERLERICAYAKGHGATVNDLLSAALFRGLLRTADYDRSLPQTASVTVDLRRFVPSGTMAAVSNLSGMGYLTLEHCESEPFADTLLRVSSQLTQWKQNLPGIQTAISMELIAQAGYEGALQWLREQALQGATSGRAIPGLTNFGRLSASAVSFGSAEAYRAYMLSPVQYAPNFALGASTYRDVLTLTIGYYESATSTRTVESFLDDLTEELAALR